MPDYEDLVFKPALSWDELKNYVWNSKFIPMNSCVAENYIEIEEISFWNDKTIMACGVEIAKNRTYEQMKNIIDNLWSE